MADTIIISADKFCASIFLDKLPELLIPQLRKIFTLMHQFYHENQEAVQTMNDYISEAAPTAKTDLARAICEYQTGFVNPERIGSPKAAKDARVKNRKLSRAVGSAKRRYERWLKIQAAWNRTQQKYAMKGT